MLTRPGEHARLCVVSNGRAARQRVLPCMRSCAAMAGWSRRSARLVHSGGSRRKLQIFCGKWTSKAGCRSPMGRRCHPLTVVDDHSRYAVCLSACANEQETTVRGALDRTFRQYGLPDAMFVDNGTPWGDSSGQRFTRFGVCLIKLGIDLLHSRPYHPQSRGKNERFHRTLKAEVFAFKRFRDLVEVQCAFDAWRTVYNPASQHPSGYVVEEKRLCWSGCDPAGYFGFCRARSAIDRAAAVASAARAKIHGPSGRGWIASISPACAASRSVLGAIRRSFAALLRLSHGSIPPSAGLNTGMR